MDSSSELNGALESMNVNTFDGMGMNHNNLISQISPISSLANSTSSLDEHDQETVSHPEVPSMSGTLLKWTNYIHGWQMRYIKLEQGTLSYFKSQEEIGYGCRGAINIIKCVIKFHEIDECRFDVGVSDSVWYLRASTEDECTSWVQAIKAQKAFYKNDSSVNDNAVSNNLTSGGGGGGGYAPSSASSSSYVPSASSSMFNSFAGAPGGAGSGVGNDNPIHRHESVLSLSSITSCRSYKEQLSEMETFRNILYQQIKTLQHYFDSSLQSTTLVNEHLKRHRRHQSMNGFNYLEIDSTRSTSASTVASDSNASTNASTTISSVTNGNKNVHGSSDSGYSELHSKDIPFVDFKKEVFTFKATTAGIIATLTQCIDLMSQREEQWKKRLEKQQEKRKSAEGNARKLQSELEETRRVLAELQLSIQRQPVTKSNDPNQKVIVIGGPDYEEGPHSLIKEDEFFDAIDAALDRSDQQEEEMRQLALRTMSLSTPTDAVPTECDHPLWPEVGRITSEQLYYARLEVDDSPSPGSSGGWELFAKEGEMKLYKRELEIDGLVCDPLKAVHIFRGVTGHEMCNEFFSPEVRFHWENTLDSMKVLEEVNSNTLVFHQIHKRVWPAAQRDAVFWSHIRRIDNDTLRSSNPNSKSSPENVWLVCNNSVDRPDVALGSCLRMSLVVSLVCETYIDPPVSDPSQITRDHIKCKMIYCSKINPGGWAPSSVLRQLYKREYPKFMKRFSQHCIKTFKDKPILL